MRHNELSRALWFESNFTRWRFLPGTASDFTRIKVLESGKLFKKNPLIWSNFTELTLMMNMRTLESEKKKFQVALRC